MIRLFMRSTTLFMLLLLSLSMVAHSNIVLAQTSGFRAPPVGAPGNREAGSARSAVCTTSDRGLVALVPESNLGLTTAAYPTFFAYLPPSSATTAEFVLYEEGTDRLIYSETLIFPANSSGILAIPLPSDGTASPLEVGHTYYWYFTLVCNPLERADDIAVQANVQRIALTSLGDEVMNQLATASLQEKPGIYAQVGVWQEALTNLAALTAARPNDLVLKQEWTVLLESVGLGAIANEPRL
jgi:hypothetical protein